MGNDIIKQHNESGYLDALCKNLHFYSKQQNYSSQLLAIAQDTLFLMLGLFLSSISQLVLVNSHALLLLLNQ
uniref:Uncharacterized protein n=1 Tax=Arundo donax TaxID=35708 RepID=A0A0A9DXY5_ARUDO